RFPARVLWELLNQAKRVRIVLSGLGIGVKLSSVVSRLNQILDSAGEIAASLKVQRKLSGNLVRTPSIVTGQVFACLPMKHSATLVHQIAVQKILIERVREA